MIFWWLLYFYIYTLVTQSKQHVTGKEKSKNIILFACVPYNLRQRHTFVTFWILTLKSSLPDSIKLIFSFFFISQVVKKTSYSCLTKPIDLSHLLLQANILTVHHQNHLISISRQALKRKKIHFLKINAFIYFSSL